MIDDNIQFISTKNQIDLSDLLKGILRKRKIFVVTLGLFFSSTLIFTAYQRIYNPIYKGSFQLLIEDPMNRTKNDRALNNVNSSIFEEIAINSTKYEAATLITLLKSPLFIEPIADKFSISYSFLAKNLDINQTTLISNNRITDAEGILNINLRINNRSKGEKILKALVDNYLQASLQRRQKRLNDGLIFLNSQAPAIQNKLNQLQTKLVNFREDNKLIEPLLEGSSLKSQQMALEDKILDLEDSANRLKVVREEILSGSLTARGFQEEMANGLSVSDFDQSLLKQLISVESEIAQAKSKYTPESTIIKGLEKRLKEIQPSLLENQLKAVDTALSLNKSRLDNLYIQKKDIEKKFLEKPALIKEYKNIEQELEIANQNLLSLVSARESFQLEMAQNSIPWRVISPPKMNNNPIEPSIPRNLFLGTVLGIFVGALAAISRDRLDFVFHSPDEVIDKIKLPLLGHIPYVKVFEGIRETKETINEEIFDSKTTNNSESYQRFFYQEAFRNVYTSIRFCNTDKKINSIVLTSSLPDEGKTLINIILAKTLSDMGEKVLLIDADMRKPALHKRLGLNNILGFSNLLSDPDLEINKVMQKVNKNANFNVITAGKIPPDPTRLLSSKRFENLIKEIYEKNIYDLIIFDAPPVLGLSDSILLAEKTDGVILLVSIENVRRNMPNESANRIFETGSTLLGTITNQRKESKDKLVKYGDYKYYGRRYQYAPTYTYQEYSSVNNDLINSDKVSDFKNPLLDKFINLKFVKKLNLKINQFLKWLDN